MRPLSKSAEWKQNEIEIKTTAKKSSASATRMRSAGACARFPGFGPLSLQVMDFKVDHGSAELASPAVTL
jgi:hypothetical protein